MNVDGWILALVFAIPAVLGTRATWRLWRIYLFDGESKSQVILLSFAIIATIITIAAVYFGALTVRRVLGFDALDWTPTVSLILASVILLIPTGLERLVAYIGRRPDTGKRRRADD